MKTHYALARFAWPFNNYPCGAVSDKAQFTNDIKKVTCKHCLKNNNGAQK